jgi:hypothetical protein
MIIVMYGGRGDVVRVWTLFHWGEVGHFLSKCRNCLGFGMAVLPGVSSHGSFLNQWVLGFFPRGKLSRTWGWPLTFMLCQSCEWVGTCLYSPCVPSWFVRGQLCHFFLLVVVRTKAVYRIVLFWRGTQCKICYSLCVKISEKKLVPYFTKITKKPRLQG